MAPLELEGDTLGQRHQHYNRLVGEAIKTNQLPESSLGDDLCNLLKIDVASKNRDVNYILAVLKSEDQLYVSKAIKRSTWLITDPKYAHIINPENLYTNLYLQMTSKAFNKLMLNIRLHLKDEKRVDAFYTYIKDKDTQRSYKWLQHCSVALVEKEIVNHRHDIPDHIIFRLLEKSFSIFEAFTKVPNYWIRKECQLLLNRHSDKFLDVLESFKDGFYFNFNAKATKILMQKCPQRILNKFDLYGQKLHMATFAKYLNRLENIQEFLLSYANNEKFQWLFTYKKIMHFVKLMPKECRFDFVRKVFIDKEVIKTHAEDYVAFRGQIKMCCATTSPNSQNSNTYQWYKFAPFDVAFTELKKLIRTESVPEQRNLMLQVLLTCASRNPQHIETVLQYYHDKHINEPFKFKIQFVNFLISKVDTHTLDEKIWNILNQLLHSLEVFVESDNNVQICVKAVIVRNIIRKEQVPDIIKQKFVFDTMKSYSKKLKKQTEKDAIFKYLLDILSTKINRLNLSVESEFNESVSFCEDLLNLMQDWGIELDGNSYALNKIKDLFKAKKVNHWSKDLSALFDIKKSWKKLMFEDSISIVPGEEVCMNALKHDPKLLSRNKEEILAMTCNDTVSLTRLLNKIRIYWPNTLAEEWKSEYLKRLDQPGGHKALIVGLCTLLPQERIVELLKEYAPVETKIDWKDTDQLKLSIRKQIAKNVHKSRPLVPIEFVLLYAKGDYLQYAVPSLNAILDQLSPDKSHICIPLLLDAPVSLQKFGVRSAFYKLTIQELKPIFLRTWILTKNASIRTVIFISTFKLLCKEKNMSQINELWDLFSTFIDKLTTDENKLIYQKLGEAHTVPDIIKPMFFMKSYTFLSSLPAKCNCENILKRMQNRASDIIGSLDNDFVVKVMLKKTFEDFLQKRRQVYADADLISCFILASKDEDMQLYRFQMSLGSILDKYLPLWEQVDENEYLAKKHIKIVLNNLADSLRITFEKKMQIPTKTFDALLSKLESNLSYQKDYVLLTTWKLLATFIKKISETDEYKDHIKEDANDENTSNKDIKNKMIGTHKKIKTHFVTMCVEYLKQDMARIGPSIYSLFAEAFVKFLDSLDSSSLFTLESKLEYQTCMLQYQNEREVWLVVHYILTALVNNIYEDDEKKKFDEIRKIVFGNACDEIKTHFYQLFADLPPYVLKST